MGKFIDLTGMRFGRLTVIRRSDKRGYWHCVCDCGNVTHSVGPSLKDGGTKSCGCFNRDAITKRNTTHGLRRTPEYLVWATMVKRCTNPNDRSFSKYGGRGIDIDPRWLDFETFIFDMGRRPSNAHSIERKENSVGYWPNNCMWATRIEQANNCRSNCVVTLNGRSMTVAQWCRELDMNYRTVKARLVQHGWTAERAFSTPTNTGFKGTNSEVTC